MSFIGREGLWSAFKRISVIPELLLKRAKSKRHVLRPEIDIESRFTWIYENNFWGNSESRSGNGSSLIYTESVRSKLPTVIEKYEIRSLLDGPCGDFNWMKEVVEKTGVNYHGVDIVAPIIQGLRAKSQSQTVKFSCLNLVEDSLPKSDLFFCRDLLFHLSFDDALSVLGKFLESGTPYLMTTSHVLGAKSVNSDIITGDFRLLDLTKAPFELPSESLETITDFLPPDPERVMKLWTRGAVSKALIRVPQG